MDNGKVREIVSLNTSIWKLLLPQTVHLFNNNQNEPYFYKLISTGQNC